MKHLPKISFGLILLLCIYVISCNAGEEKQPPSEQKITNFEIATQYTSKEIYLELYKRKNNFRDTIPLDRITKEYSTQELRQINKKLERLQFVSTDSVYTVYNYLLSTKAIYAEDNRKEVYEVTDPKVKNDATKVVALIEKKFIQSVSATEVQLNPGSKLSVFYNLCLTGNLDNRFFDQGVIAKCTGVAVGKNKILTAGHCLNETNFSNFVFVFDVVADPATHQVVRKIDRSKIYEITSVTAIQGNPFVNDFRVATVSGPPIPDSRIAKPRLTGKIALKEQVHVIGTPSGLPLKVADSAIVFFNDQAALFKINSDTYKGNSGSPVFNSKTHVLEGILVRGENDFEFILSDKCQKLVRCPEVGCFGEDIIRASQFLKFIK